MRIERRCARKWLHACSSIPFLQRGCSNYDDSFNLISSGQLQFGCSFNGMVPFHFCFFFFFPFYMMLEFVTNSKHHTRSSAFPGFSWLSALLSFSSEHIWSLWAALSNFALGHIYSLVPVTWDALLWFVENKQTKKQRNKHAWLYRAAALCWVSFL